MLSIGSSLLAIQETKQLKICTSRLCDIVSMRALIGRTKGEGCLYDVLQISVHCVDTIVKWRGVPPEVEPWL